jgi:5-methylcytosine-specific restriction endonuclease McrA
MLCKYCSKDVPLRVAGQSGRQAEFCSDECRKSFYYAPKIEKFCILCGSVFVVSARNKLKKYCSNSCGAAARFPANDSMTKNCVECVGEFVTQIKKQRFCSLDCRYIHHGKLQAEIWRTNNPRPEFYLYKCDWCQEEIKHHTWLGGPKKYHANCALEARQVRYRAKTTRKRSNVKPSRVSIELLVSTYGAICWICNSAIDMDLPRTNRFGATVDHVIPLSKGGSDDFDNLKLAHWICNIRKSDKIVEQNG